MRFQLPFVRRSKLTAYQVALEDCNSELQKCMSALFYQKRKSDEELAHVIELYKGSPVEIGGIKLLWKDVERD